MGFNTKCSIYRTSLEKLRIGIESCPIWGMASIRRCKATDCIQARWSYWKRIAIAPCIRAEVHVMVHCCNSKYVCLSFFLTTKGTALNHCTNRPDWSVLVSCCMCGGDSRSYLALYHMACSFSFLGVWHGPEHGKFWVKLSSALMPYMLRSKYHHRGVSARASMFRNTAKSVELINQKMGIG